MKITFLGTRGYIDIATRHHKRHTTTMITYKKKRILIDCGLDWLGRMEKLAPNAIMITHAHPDHAWGLQDGAPCPVYATVESWTIMKNYPIKERVTLIPRHHVNIFGLTFEAFPVEHSIRAPGVGFRIQYAKLLSSVFMTSFISMNKKMPLKGSSSTLAMEQQLNDP